MIVHGSTSLIGCGVAGWSLSATAGFAWMRCRRALHAQREALRIACHELRGPLFAVGLGVRLDGRIGASSSARVRAIELELERAALALEDLADLAGGGANARACAPGMVESELVVLGPLLADSVEAWRPVAGGRDLRLELPPGPGPMIYGNRVRLAQATGNLIANAIEHGDGSVIVRARVSGRHVRVEVADGGVGLSATVAVLTRSGRRRGLRRRGMRLLDSERGRGLSIASAIAAAHGGRLFSAPASRGALVVLELPLARLGAYAPEVRDAGV